VTNELRTDSADSGRDALIAAIMAFFAGQDLLAREDIRAALERELLDAGAGALIGLKERLADDRGWDYYPSDPIARRVHHLLAGRFLAAESRVTGAHHLATVGAAPVVILANHLSYADANVVEVLLQRIGGAALADRLTALAGPKVFTSRDRRFSSLCFGTVKVPQSAEVSSGEAVLTARDVARAARQSIEAACGRLAAGDALLLFGEGTRSRAAAMQPMLAGVARYLEVPGTWVLPIGLSGPEALFAVTDSVLRPARILMEVGAPIRADRLVAAAGRDRRIVMDAIGRAVAALGPEPYRGTYASAADFPAAAAALATARSAASLPGADG
jgi:1-acyl-sn-glycerol-3-phosphate acyltransferase